MVRVLYLLFAATVIGGEVAWAAMSPPPADPAPVIKVIQTSQDLGQRLAPVGELRFRSKQPSGVPVIHMSDSVRYQRIVGVGAAMTDSSAWLLYTQLPRYLFKKTMDALFGPGGIHLGFIRVPMGASDFSANGHPYTYDDDSPGGLDPSLRYFSLGHDRPYILPALREALTLNPAAEIIATPWTPPEWMKIFNTFGNNDDASYLLPSEYGALANYFVKFLRGYAQAKVPVAAVTPQNEPGQGTWYPGLNLPEWAEASFVADYLKPALRRARLKTAIFGYDYSWSTLVPPYVSSLLTGPAGQDLAGIAFHCYYGSPTVMSTLHRQEPRLEQWVTECTTQTDPTWSPPELEIASLRNWASAVSLWNLALDPAGGPVQAPNSACQGCTGVVTVDKSTHQVSFGAPYFQLGQVSKFLKPGAVRLYSNHFVKYSAAGPGAGLDDVAFLNPDGTEALVAYNNSSAPTRFAVVWHHESFLYDLPAGAMVTFAWRSTRLTGE